jgi:hypothetical protein
LGVIQNYPKTPPPHPKGTFKGQKALFKGKSGGWVLNPPKGTSVGGLTSPTKKKVPMGVVQNHLQKRTIGGGSKPFLTIIKMPKF